MGLLDKVKKAAGQHGDKIEKGIDKAAAVADKRTKGKQSARLRDMADKAKDAVDKLAGDEGDKGEPEGPPSRTKP